MALIEEGEEEEEREDEERKKKKEEEKEEEYSCRNDTIKGIFWDRLGGVSSWAN